MSKHYYPDQIRVVEETHSRFGGSSAERWLKCAASVPLVGAIPPMVENSFAREGKIAHALAEYCLARDMRDAAEFAGIEFTPWPAKPNEKFTIDRRMCDAVQEYLNLAYELIDEAGKAGRFWVEVRFRLDIPGAGGQVFGKADLVIYNATLRRLYVIDYKHGTGISVPAAENAQGKHYGLGALQEIRRSGWIDAVEDVEIIVVQPNDWRNGSGDLEPVRRWTISAVDLELFGTEIEDAVQAALRAEELMKAGVAIDHLFKTGEHCSKCDAAAVCPARKHEVLELANVDSLNEITPSRMADPAIMDPAELANALRAADVMDAWAKQVFKYADSLARQGITVPGYKLVEKLSRAKWVAAASA